MRIESQRKSLLENKTHTQRYAVALRFGPDDPRKSYKTELLSVFVEQNKEANEVCQKLGIKNLKEFPVIKVAGHKRVYNRQYIEYERLIETLSNVYRE